MVSFVHMSANQHYKVPATKEMDTSTPPPQITTHKHKDDLVKGNMGQVRQRDEWKNDQLRHPKHVLISQLLDGLPGNFCKWKAVITDQGKNKHIEGALNSGMGESAFIISPQGGASSA